MNNVFHQPLTCVGTVQVNIRRLGTTLFIHYPMPWKPVANKGRASSLPRKGRKAAVCVPYLGIYILTCLIEEGNVFLARSGNIGIYFVWNLYLYIYFQRFFFSWLVKLYTFSVTKISVGLLKATKIKDKTVCQMKFDFKHVFKFSMSCILVLK